MVHMKKMVSSHKQLVGGIVWVDAVPKNPVSLPVCKHLKLLDISAD